MPELSSQTPGARKGAMGKISQTGGGSQTSSPQFDDTAYDQALPEVERGLDFGPQSGQEPIGTAATKRRMEEDRMADRQAAKDAPEKTAQAAQAAEPAEEMADMDEGFDEKDVGRMLSQVRQKGVKETAKSTVASAASKITNEAINQGLISSGGAGLVAPPEGWVYYILCLASLWLIGLGFAELGKKVVLKIFRLNPMAILPGFGGAYSDALDVIEQMKLKLSAEDWLETFGLTAPLIIAVGFILFLIIILVGPILAVNDLGSNMMDWIEPMLGPLYHLFK